MTRFISRSLSVSPGAWSVPWRDLRRIHLRPSDRLRAWLRARYLNGVNGERRGHGGTALHPAYRAGVDRPCVADWGRPVRPVQGRTRPGQERRRLSMSRCRDGVGTGETCIWPRPDASLDGTLRLPVIGDKAPSYNAWRLGWRVRSSRTGGGVGALVRWWPIERDV